MPNGDGTHDTADTVTKETDGNGAQDDSCGTQWKVVEEVLSCEDHDTGGSVRGRCRRDGTDGVLLERPRTRVDEMNGREPLGTVALATLLPPSSLKLVSAGEECGPRLAEEVGDEYDEGA